MAAVDDDIHDRPIAATALTAFQRDILAVLANSGPEYGLGIKHELQTLYDVPINHGRLYPNLDDLVTAGLITRSERDKRTNDYALTEAGERVLQEYHDWQTACLDGTEGDRP